MFYFHHLITSYGIFNIVCQMKLAPAKIMWFSYKIYSQKICYFILYNVHQLIHRKLECQGRNHYISNVTQGASTASCNIMKDNIFCH